MKTSAKVQRRNQRQKRVRAKVCGTAARPRLSVYRSNNAIYAQLIDDDAGKVVVSSSSLKEKAGANTDAAKKVGADIAKLAKGKKVTTCVFDRGGNLYHGRVKALAEAAREGGLQF